MTVRPADVVRVALSQLGYTEQGGAHHDGNETIFGKWFGLDRNPWCDMFVSWAAYTAGAPQGPRGSKGFASCSAHLAWARKQGLVVSKPMVGALVFFTYSHVGIITRVRTDGTFDVCAGNTTAQHTGDDRQDRNGGVVANKTYTRSKVLAFAKLEGVDYGAMPTKVVTGRPVPKTLQRVLGLASPYTKGDDVTLLQRRLVALKLLAKDEVDGVYGERTERAVKAFQRARKLKVDGVVGAVTWHALWAR